VDKDIENLNGIVDNDTIRRKEEYKRTIKKVSKPDLFTFYELIITTSAFSGQGEKLRNEEKMEHNRKRRKGLSRKVDFGEYMKRWRFR